ncbi:MAG: 50S ribosomal protein L25 [Peptococcaceae bacterium]|nr:50S ribosomal protein L25 [Peptococcaceae bacterium]
MFNLKAQRRDKRIKAKRLRREGIIPASIYGRNLKGSILIQIPLADVNRFLSTASKGSALTIEVDNEKYNALCKEISRDPISRQVEQIEFQHIVADEAVNSVIKVVLANRDKNQNLIQQHLEEIPYHALPRYFVPEVIIDLEGMEAGSSVKVGDLEVAKNENVKLTIPEDTLIVSVAELKRMVLPETEAEAAEKEAGKEA